MANEKLLTDSGDEGKKKKVPPGGFFKNVQIQYIDDPNAHHITLPMLEGKPMTEEQGIYWLTKIKEEKERIFEWEYKFEGWYPLDAMWAVYRQMVETYGFTHTHNFVIETFFGPIVKPPKMMSIDIDLNNKQQIPWGPLEVSGISVPLEPSIVLSKGIPTLQLSAKVRNNEKGILAKVMRKCEQLLTESSIYKGKAIEVDFEIFNPRDFMFDETRAPKFMDTNIEKKDVIFSQDVYDLINVNLWTLVEKMDLCIQHKIPLRRNILLEGKFGVGKTLAARLTARKCEENGWTFLYLRNLKQLKQALYFAKKYEPCVIFAEDINSIVSGERTDEMNEIFNTMDGIDRKNDRVMTVFTTNEVNAINPGMLRPGRMDAIITVEPPDGLAVQQLMRLYGRELIDPAEDLSEVGEMLAGQIPAVIREVVERSKLASLLDVGEDGKQKVTAHHLRISALQGLQHAARLAPPPPKKPDIELLGEAIGDIFRKGAYMALEHPDHPTKNYTAASAATHVMDKAGRPS